MCLNRDSIGAIDKHNWNCQFQLVNDTFRSFHPVGTIEKSHRSLCRPRNVMIGETYN